MECHVGIMALIGDLLGGDSGKRCHKLHKSAFEFTNRTDR